jgi:hypothetical protein
MKRHGSWNVEVDRDEQPDNSYYAVTFYRIGKREPVARVNARIYTNFGERANEVSVDRLKPDDLKSVDDSEFLEIAETEVNSLPGFQEYVLFPGVMPNPFGKEEK